MAPGAAVAALVPSTNFAQTVSKPRLILRSSRPEDLETPVHLLNSWITPNDLFYVRSHFYTPSVNADAWRLRIDGEVETPLELSLDDLRRTRATAEVVTLECAGNGRAFFDPPVAGIQWEKGAVGTAEWTGVRLADVLRQAGVKPSGRYVWLDGADAGIGRAPDFIRSLPIDKATDGSTLLAYAMNGEMLPVPHGFPLRAIVPGWEAAYSVKWLTHIRVSQEEHPGPFVQSGYRYPRHTVRPGAVVPPSETVPLRSMPVKSLITAPATNASIPPGGRIGIRGFAWAGESGVRRVDVSVNGGQSWYEARLGRDRARYAWRAFEYDWQPAGPGSHLVLSRAIDDRGLMQPVIPAWNPAGYVWNAIDRIRIDVAVAGETAMAPGGEAATAAASVPDPVPDSALLKSRCMICHDSKLIGQQRLTADGWRREVDKMVGWGAEVTAAERDALVNDLARLYPSHGVPRAR